MQFPKLTPLQARFLASSIACIVLFVLIWFFQPNNFADAAEIHTFADGVGDELDSSLLGGAQDHNHHRISPRGPFFDSSDIDLGQAAEFETDDTDTGTTGTTSSHELSERDWETLYEPEFIGGVSGVIIGKRADEGSTSLGNNQGPTFTVKPGKTNFYTFKNATVWGPYGVKGTGLPNSLMNKNIIRVGRGDDLALGGDPDEGEVDDGDMDESNEGTRRVKRQDDGANDDSSGDTSGDGDSEKSTEKSRRVYISANVCEQPEPKASASGTTTTADVPQLTMYVSTSQSNKRPGPDNEGKEQQEVPLTGGFANYTLNATRDVFIGVHGPNMTDGSTGSWSYELAASIDEPYHSYIGSDPFLFLVDSDSNAALFVTHNLTRLNASEEENQNWMDEETPFDMFAFPNPDSKMKGMSSSYCAMKRAFGQSGMKVDAGMTTRGIGQHAKGQFFLNGLAKGSDYSVYLALKGNGTMSGSDTSEGVISGGGTLWRPLQLETKLDGNCQLIYNLSFCSETAYAVPSNPSAFDTHSLASLYDNNTQALFQNFSYSLDQVACNTTPAAMYSLARNCDDCSRSYKDWLCTVTIPKCEDFSNNATYLQPRDIDTAFLNGSAPPSVQDPHFANNATLKKSHAENRSRNKIIDTVIKPGPYKEVLPCAELCYGLVQSCPAKLGFTCPTPDLIMGNGIMGKSYATGPWEGTCNYPGAVEFPSIASRRMVGGNGLVVLIACLVTAMITWT